MELAQTHGDLDIVDHRVPASHAPARRVHHRQDEVFSIIDGQLTVHCADRTWRAGPGSLVFLPRGVPHGFEVSADGPGRTLLVNALTLPGPDVAQPHPERIAQVQGDHRITPPPTNRRRDPSRHRGALQVRVELVRGRLSSSAPPTLLRVMAS